MMTPWGFDFPLHIQPKPVVDRRVYLSEAGYLTWSGYVTNDVGWKEMVRGDHICSYCLEWFDRLTADHVKPVMKGGIHENNIVGACQKCNVDKGHKKLLRYLIEIGGLQCDFSSTSPPPTPAPQPSGPTLMATALLACMEEYPALKSAWLPDSDGETPNASV